MTNVRSFIVGLAVLVLLILGGVYIYQKSIKPTILSQKTDPTPQPESKFKAITYPQPTPTVEAEKKTDVTIAPATGVDPQNVGINISHPQSQNKILSPTQIKGSANVENSIVNVVILDANRLVLGSSKLTACMAADSCPIQGSVNFAPAKTKTGFIEVYSNATPTNPQPNLQTIIVSF